MVFKKTISGGLAYVFAKDIGGLLVTSVSIFLSINCCKMSIEYFAVFAKTVAKQRSGFS
jgi:hypothetical protein